LHNDIPHTAEVGHPLFGYKHVAQGQRNSLLRRFLMTPCHEHDTMNTQFRAPNATYGPVPPNLGTLDTQGGLIEGRKERQCVNPGMKGNGSGLGNDGLRVMA
jgi:hypothetical protein